MIGDCCSGSANNGGCVVEALGFDVDAPKSFLSLLYWKTDCMEEQRVVVVLEQQRIAVVANGIESDFPVSLMELVDFEKIESCCVVRVIYQSLN